MHHHRPRFAMLAILLSMSVLTPPSFAQDTAPDGPAEPVGAVLAFEVDGLSPREDYVNRVTVGGQEVAVLEDAVDGFSTVEVPIPAAMLSSGETDVRIESVPLTVIEIPLGIATTGTAGPVDTFHLRDVRLLLPDGTELRDRDHQPGVAYEVTGEQGDMKILAPVKYNPGRRYLFDLPAPTEVVGDVLDVTATGVAGSGDAKPLRDDADLSATPDPTLEGSGSVTGGDGSPIDGDLTSLLADADGRAVETAVVDGFPVQDLTLQVGDLPDDQAHVHLRWQGEASEGRGVALHGFDHDLGRFVRLASTRGGGEQALTATADVASFVREGSIRVLLTEAPMDTVADSDFTIAWVTDSQFQTQANLRPADLPGQVADWLVANAETRGIDYMAYTGDLTENFGYDPSEFTYISEALQPLDDAGFPYGVVPGNHDYAQLGLTPSDEVADDLGTDPDLTVYAQFFGADRFEGRPHYLAQHRNNENHVDLLELGGRQLAFLYLGWDLQPEELAWAEEQLTGPLAGIPTILAVHEYLDLGEVLEAKGRTLLQEVVMPHDNVFAVISGHYHGVAYQVRRTGERLVLEMLHDYQDETEGGAAFFRLLHVDLEAQQLSNREYSPHHDDFLIEGFDVQRQEYTVPLQLLGEPREGRIATDQLLIGTSLVADRVRRLAGPGRVDTAVAVSRAAHDTADVVVLARADAYADALAGAPLATQLGGPLLLTDADHLSPATAAELVRLGATRAVLLGGEAALSPAVVADLQAAGVEVERVAGGDRFATAAAIARRVGVDGEVLLVEGAASDPARGWPDAVSAAALGAVAGVPVLLATAEGLPPQTAALLDPDVDVTVVGGPAAVPEAIVADVDARAGAVTRLAGDTRYATAVAVAEEALRRGATPGAVLLATGRDWPDALTAGAAAGALGGLVLLVDGVGGDGPALPHLAGLDAETVYLVGGPSAITGTVEQAVRGALR